MSNHIPKQDLDKLIREHRFRDLLVRLGWDLENLPEKPFPLSLPNGKTFHLDRVAEKRGFVVCVCDAGENFPKTKAERRHLLTQLARQHYEHLLIIHGQGEQCWMVSIRPQNRPLQVVQVDWHEQKQDIQPLMEKLDGMFFDISEEDTLGITDVVDRVRNAFMANAEKVTKKFYTRFKTELSNFSDFIEGIEAQVSKDWYAALMLNRLMFIYFIQKKHFLDGDPNYLENRLHETKFKYGEDKFHNRFYKCFLRRLFAEGLGAPEPMRDAGLKQLLGQVPYLNGGLFDLHEIEQDNKGIEIPDKAFEMLFAFFGEYNWHLDSRADAGGKDINPDVIGYIFEKYINDRASMGAYYTQEDITGYIARNTIVPFLLNRTKEKCKNAFDPETGIWRFLRENPDHYIYDAVNKGCEFSNDQIPENIRRGIDTNQPDLIERRKDWNTKTPECFALPTEIWRETMARRQRYFELKAKITNGEVHEIDDLITYNLDIERFASDALLKYEGLDFFAAFYEAIAGRKATLSNQQDKRGISVLDPACGSGAFLFAALNILEPLYQRCIARMREFVDDDENLRAIGERKGTKKHQQFREVLRDIETHQNEKYWIYKTIILNNLYGVDLMKEAAEIAKLRLFLKLAAEAEYRPDNDNLGLEPLPDIDFNIRSGNSLVGFISMAQFEEVVSVNHQPRQHRLGHSDLTKGIREQAGEVQTANDAFKAAQDAGSEGYQEAKRELTQRLDALNDGMNRYLAEQYDQQGESDYPQWLQSHQPFHWVTEFYGIIVEDGGFDVVIGNPPYVEYQKVKQDYTVKDYQTESCGNIYSYFVERAFQWEKTCIGFIVPLPSVNTKRMKKLQRIINPHFNNLDRKIWFSFFDERPSSLFKDVDQRLTIFCSSSFNKSVALFTTGIKRWTSRTRSFLFANFHYSVHAPELLKNNYSVMKINNSLIEKHIVRKFSSNEPIFMFKSKQNTKEVLYYRTAGGRYWKVALNKPFDTENASEKKCFFHTITALSATSLISSSLFWWYYSVNFDMYNLADYMILGFCFSDFDRKTLKHIDVLGREYLTSIEKNAKIKTIQSKTQGVVKQRQFEINQSKHIIDKIDSVLAQHYNFTEEELDYIINYDIKYRMGLGG